MIDYDKTKRWGVRKLLTLATLFLFAIPSLVLAAGAQGEHNFAMSFFWIALILIVAKMASLVERVGQPSVLGELLVGMLLGNLVLFGIPYFEGIKSDQFIAFLAELGVIILLFQIGLESNVKEMKSVGVSALSVAALGVIVPFVAGAYIMGPWLFPENSLYSHLFLGAAFTATSVGITMRVFQDLGFSKSKEAKTILGAAVIDDVLGLIILAVLSGFVVAGVLSVSTIGFTIGKAVLFLGGAIVVGQLTAPILGKAMSKINTGIGMKFTLAVSFCLTFAYLAQLIGLAPIVGAFAAGLVLDAVHFRFFRNSAMVDEIKEATEHASWGVKQKIRDILDSHSRHHIEELMEPLTYLIVPIFFVYTAMSVDVSVLADTTILVSALLLSLVAIIGKAISGVAAGSANKLIVGFGMVPRGEVGLIFAAIGSEMGVISTEIFSIIVIMVILTTLVTPPILAYLIKRQEEGRPLFEGFSILHPLSMNQNKVT